MDYSKALKTDAEQAYLARSKAFGYGTDDGGIDGYIISRQGNRYYYRSYPGSPVPLMEGERWEPRSEADQKTSSAADQLTVSSYPKLRQTEISLPCGCSVIINTNGRYVVSSCDK